MTEKGIMIELT